MSKLNKANVLSRRDFFKKIGEGSIGTYLVANQNFIKVMGSAIATLMMRETLAADGAKNYLCFLHGGAPPRWNFDGFLASEKPIVNGQATSEFIPHPVVKNVFKNSSGYQTAYNSNNSDTSYETSSNPAPYFSEDGSPKQLFLPKLWDITLPTWNGSAAIYDSSNPVLMRDLISNTLLIRGFQLPADFGHFGGPAYLIQPDPALPSVSGLVADRGSSASNRRLIPAVALTDNPSRPLGFRSEGSKLTLGTTGSSNKASDILSPFIRTDSLVANHKGNRALMDAVLKEAKQEYRNRAQAENSRNSALFNDNDAVDLLMAKLKSVDLVTEFTQARNKYIQLGRACAEKFPGLVGELKLTKNSSGSYTSHPYASDNYSSHFALAEVFIRNSLSSSFTFLCGGSAAPGSYVGYSNNAHSAQNDEHNVSDRQRSFLAHNWKNRFFMSCVQAFKGAIGASWKDTVIQFGAEYNRSPNKGSGGSDHAINACCTTVISGGINSFLPVGNIYVTKQTDPNHKNYGTYGVGAPTQITGVGSIQVTHKIVANTVLTLLGITSPFRDKWSLIKPDAGGFSLNAESPKNKVV
jgi:hypothetical protein